MKSKLLLFFFISVFVVSCTPQNYGITNFSPATVQQAQTHSAGSSLDTNGEEVEVFMMGNGIPRFKDSKKEFVEKLSFPSNQDEIDRKLSINFLVDEDGIAKDFVVENSSNSTFEQHVINTLKDTKFIPGKMNGKAVRFLMNLSLKY